MSVIIEQCPPDELYFDEKNPRFAGLENTMDQNKILNNLWRTQDAKGIVISILANGFFPNEALYVISEGGRKVVLEGNRRLAAVKSIIHPELVDRGGMDQFRPKITEDLKVSLETGIPVIYVEDRKDTWRYIGFKHVNGAAKWDSYAKAKYIAVVYIDYKVPLEKIAEQIGDSNSLVLKLYQGLMVLQQADRLTDFKIANVYFNRLYFSHVYTAMGYEGFRNYLGITQDSANTETPVPPDKLKKLEEVMLWILGSKLGDIKPVIKSQNPDLRKLNQVLTSKEAIETLRLTQDLDEAFEASERPSDILYNAIVDAKIKVEKALSKVSFYNGDKDSLRSAMDLANSADALFDSMKKIFNQEKSKDQKRSLD
jgi:hypothetical protein